MKFPAAPVLGSHVGDGFSEVPAVAVEILAVILALAVGMVFRFAQNHRSILPRSLAMTCGILNADLRRLRMVRRYVSFSYRETAVPSFHLDPVISDTQANLEAESLSQPLGSRARIGISEHGDYSARWCRTVRSHSDTLALRSSARIVTQFSK